MCENTVCGDHAQFYSKRNKKIIRGNLIRKDCSTAIINSCLNLKLSVFFYTVTLDYHSLVLLTVKKDNEEFVLGGKGYSCELSIDQTDIGSKGLSARPKT